MNDTLLSAVIGASSAVLINGVIYLLSLRNQIRREKIGILSEIICNLNIQKKYSVRYVGHKTWLNYYFSFLEKIKIPETKPLVHDKIEQRLRNIEDIETKFLESGAQLSTLTAKYRKYFPKDQYYLSIEKNIQEFTISDKIKIQDFTDWEETELSQSQMKKRIQEEESKSQKMLDDYFETSFNIIIDTLEKKILAV